MNSKPPSVPKENPLASPPKPGEQVASDFKIQTDTQIIEVEGVCKLTEDEAICWKPNGDSNDELAKELTSAIESNTNSYSNGFQFKFKKKNRILVLKTTTPPRKPGQEGGSYGGNLVHNYASGPDFMEGWTSNYSIFSGASSTSFDQTRVERSVMTGAFNPDTETFPLRYEMTKYERTPATSIPAKKGQIEVAGNTYEIVSMSDKSPQPGYAPPRFGPNVDKAKYTYLTIKPIKITDPYALVTLAPADDTGAPYGGLDANGNPISAAAAAKKREEDQKKMMEAAKAGKPYVGYQSIAPTYIQPIGLDPRNTAKVLMMAVNVEPSKLKKFAVNVQHRTVYVFDKVKLDKN
ncbi:MAG TPA: hypothetical protein VK171_16855 [Fimbriimonas sp.]|nr:hypothetical protein [Fimbriimonas sp.]